MRVLADTWRRSGLVWGTPLLFVEYAGAHESVHYGVRVAVGGRPAILQVALLLLGDCPRYPDAAAAVCDSCKHIFIKFCNQTSEMTSLNQLGDVEHLPALKSLILAVSWRPVNRLSLSFPPRGSYTLMCFICTLDSLSIAFSISLKR